MLFYRSSHRRCFVRKGVLRNFAKFTGKNLHQSLYFIKKETLVQAFSCEFCEISKNTFSPEHLQTTASVFSIDHFCFKIRINISTPNISHKRQKILSVFLAKLKAESFYFYTIFDHMTSIYWYIKQNNEKKAFKMIELSSYNHKFVTIIWG